MDLLLTLLCAQALFFSPSSSFILPTYCPERQLISYAEHYLMAHNVLHGYHWRNKTFLELGAGNELSVSQTLVLEKCLHWKGVLVGDVSQLQKIRPSGLVAKIPYGPKEAPLGPLAEHLPNVPHIDLLILKDVEVSELIPHFTTHRVVLMVVIKRTKETTRLGHDEAVQAFRSRNMTCLEYDLKDASVCLENRIWKRYKNHRESMLEKRLWLQYNNTYHQGICVWVAQDNMQRWYSKTECAELQGWYRGSEVLPRNMRRGVCMAHNGTSLSRAPYTGPCKCWLSSRQPTPSHPCCCSFMDAECVPCQEPVAHVVSENTLSPNASAYALAMADDLDSCRIHARFVDTDKLVVSSVATALLPPNWINNTGLPWLVYSDKLPDASNPFPDNYIKKTNQFGNEVSGILEFLISHYHCLPLRMAFVHHHDDLSRHSQYERPRETEDNPTTDENYSDLLLKLCWDKIDHYLPLVSTSTSVGPDFAAFPMVVQTLKKLLPDYDPPKELFFFCCGTFVIHRKAVLVRSLEFWRNMYAILNEYEQRKLDTAYLAEYMWSSILGPPGWESWAKELHRNVNRRGEKVTKPYLAPARMWTCNENYPAWRAEALVMRRRERERKAEAHANRIKLVQAPNSDVGICFRHTDRRGNVGPVRIYSELECLNISGQWAGIVKIGNGGECLGPSGSFSGPGFNNYCECVLLPKCQLTDSTAPTGVCCKYGGETCFPCMPKPPKPN
eukprot:gb/GEZN01003416.1/.p1 GENE.gb/GEZN01003416.1/~~gb/GEZN01003416.1/.p1  ORF type:complete len:727 (-),score=50.43 gb/GEZN01003416.1/:2-2182(-)